MTNLLSSGSSAPSDAPAPSDAAAAASVLSAAADIGAAPAGGAAARAFLLPDLGEGLEEAEVVSWLVSAGDVITVDQLVVEVESAKSIVELPSPFAGRVESVHAAVGDVVPKGAPLITVVPVGAPDAHAADPAPDLVPGTALRPTADTEPVSSGAVLVGYGTKESTLRLKRPEGGRFRGRGTAGVTDPADSTNVLPTPAVAHETAAGGASAPPAQLIDVTRQSPVVSPIVRKRARDNGFEASHLRGSGRDGLVLRDDVEAVIRARAGETTTAADAPRPADPSGATPVGATAVVLPAVPSSIGVGDVRIPLTGLRKLVAARLSESRRVIPEATIWLDVDATELFTAKERLQKSTGERFSLTALIARFAVAGLKQYPILNSSMSPDGREIIQHGSINLGLAAQTPRGLMVPVVHGAHDMTTRQLRDAITDLVSTSERGDFAPPALTGGTFTLNNYGGFGVDGSTPIINHPEVAMLGVGRVLERPWVVDHQLAVRRVMQLSFVFDHRVCDGDVASGFLTYVARCIEEPLLLLGNV
ncbi:dihydrolipoamide acetyltransferase family protein [Subtercola sp. YIM 133946]|uniref:dihydrolipoamide acetyltransferase family protein n=1 Tax=Subtercola sp. YIM 133946 TaxID=3118909 RepID=UPI002F92FB77